MADSDLKNSPSVQAIVLVALVQRLEKINGGRPVEISHAEIEATRGMRLIGLTAEEGLTFSVAPYEHGRNN